MRRLPFTLSGAQRLPPMPPTGVRRQTVATKVLWLAALVAASCSADVNGQNLSDKDCEAARKLYVAKCAKCHRFYEPTAYSESAWRDWMAAMSRKAKLNSEQQELLVRYLGTYRAGKLPGKPQEKPKRK
jgi:hypothetical protein